MSIKHLSEIVISMREAGRVTGKSQETLQTWMTTGIFGVVLESDENGNTSREAIDRFLLEVASKRNNTMEQQKKEELK